MWVIGNTSRRPRWFARATGGCFPRFSGGVPRGSRYLAPPRHALLAESLGKPSLWVITKDHWYWGAVRYSVLPGGGPNSGLGASVSLGFQRVRASAAARR